jgi:hypothetical protein
MDERTLATRVAHANPTLFLVLNTNRVSQIHGQRPAQVLQHIACRAETRGSLVPSGDNRDTAGPRREQVLGK